MQSILTEQGFGEASIEFVSEKLDKLLTLSEEDADAAEAADEDDSKNKKKHVEEAQELVDGLFDAKLKALTEIKRARESLLAKLQDDNLSNGSGSPLRVSGLDGDSTWHADGKPKSKNKPVLSKTKTQQSVIKSGEAAV